MRAITLIFIGMTLLNPVFSAELYRWVDEQGRIHYSDRPREGAETITVQTRAPAASRPAPARSEAPAAATRPAPPRPDPDAVAVAYESVSISSPQPDEVLWNIGSELDVRVDIKPALQPTHRVVVRYDGQPVENWPFGATSHRIPQVYRGTHTLSATVTDASGKVLATSGMVTFYVKQTSVLN